MNKKLIFVSLVAASVATLSACGGGGGGGSDSGKKTVTLTGSVIDADTDNDLAGVTVQLGTHSATTDANGEFTLANLQAAQRAVVQLSKSGYVDEFEIVRLIGGVDADIEVEMAETGTTETIDAGVNNTITDGGADITISADSLVNADGSTFTGQATVEFTAFDPVFDDSFPGDYEGVQNDGTVVPIKSYGYFNIDASDDEGNPLNLQSGSDATVTVSVSPGLQASAPATIPLWHFDEATGQWDEVGTGTYNSATQQYEGQIPHFSYWNFDHIIAPAYISGTVTDCEGKPVANATVIVSSTGTQAKGYTNALGVFSNITVESGAGGAYITAQKGTHVSGSAFVTPPDTANGTGTADIVIASICPAGQVLLEPFSGFDFSLATNDYDADGYDSDGWLERACGSIGDPNDDGAYWCPHSDVSGQFKDMGNVSLESVTSTPSTWDSEVSALQVNHVYVFAAKDGYVKMKVLSLIDVGGGGIAAHGGKAARVSYVYSNNRNF